MRIIYPYNEILPKKRAHDTFIVHECAALADLGGEVTLLVGKGSEKDNLFSHYAIPPSNPLHIKTLFILRKNNRLGLSWNLPFFWCCQKEIQKILPDYVILSVRKQAAFHLSHKIPGVRYVYEVHELCYYPNQPFQSSYQLQLEKKALSHADLVTVTTAALKDILLAPPYSLKVPIEIVPLAVQAKALPLPSSLADPLVIAYVGQLYEGQGVANLLLAMSQVQNVHLKIIGGRVQEIAQLSKLAKEMNVAGTVEFLGFIPPSQISSLVQEAHAFIAPFENTGRMPYVAHTKLFEYVEWGRPIIAPNLPIVQEHFQQGSGAILFEPDNPSSIAKCISALKDDHLRQKLQNEISSCSGCYSWRARAQTYARLLQVDG